MDRTEPNQVLPEAVDQADDTLRHRVAAGNCSQSYLRAICITCLFHFIELIVICNDTLILNKMTYLLCLLSESQLVTLIYLLNSFADIFVMFVVHQQKGENC